METFVVSLGHRLVHIKQYRVMIVCDSSLGDMVLQLQTRCSTSEIVRKGYFMGLYVYFMYSCEENLLHTTREVWY